MGGLLRCSSLHMSTLGVPIFSSATSFLGGFHLDEMLGTDESHDHSDGGRKCRGICLNLKRIWSLNRIFLASPDHSSSSCCKDITIPIHLVSIWQREHKSIIYCLSDDRGRIRYSAPASNVPYDRNGTIGGSGKYKSHSVEDPLIQEPHPV